MFITLSKKDSILFRELKKYGRIPCYTESFDPMYGALYNILVETGFKNDDLTYIEAFLPTMNWYQDIPVRPTLINRTFGTLDINIATDPRNGANLINCSGSLTDTIFTLPLEVSDRAHMQCSNTLGHGDAFIFSPPGGGKSFFVDHAIINTSRVVFYDMDKIPQVQSLYKRFGTDFWLDEAKLLGITPLLIQAILAFHQLKLRDMTSHSDYIIILGCFSVAHAGDSLELLRHAMHLVVVDPPNRASNLSARSNANSSLIAFEPFDPLTLGDDVPLYESFSNAMHDLCTYSLFCPMSGFDCSGVTYPSDVIGVLPGMSRKGVLVVNGDVCDLIFNEKIHLLHRSTLHKCRMVGDMSYSGCGMRNHAIERAHNGIFGHYQDGQIQVVSSPCAYDLGCEMPLIPFSTSGAPKTIVTSRPWDDKSPRECLLADYKSACPTLKGAFCRRENEFSAQPEVPVLIGSKSSNSRLASERFDVVARYELNGTDANTLPYEYYAQRSDYCPFTGFGHIVNLKTGEDWVRVLADVSYKVGLLTLAPYKPCAGRLHCSLLSQIELWQTKQIRIREFSGEVVSVSMLQKEHRMMFCYPKCGHLLAALEGSEMMFQSYLWYRSCELSNKCPYFWDKDFGRMRFFSSHMTHTPKELLQTVRWVCSGKFATMASLIKGPSYLNLVQDRLLIVILSEMFQLRPGLVGYGAILLSHMDEFNSELESPTDWESEVLAEQEIYANLKYGGV